MKKAGKIIAVVLAVVIAVVGIVVGVTQKEIINYYFNEMHNAVENIKDGSYKDAVEGGSDSNEATENQNTLEFTPGSYGLKEFKTMEDAVNYYVECYDNTKAKTSTYVDEDGNDQTFYSMLGTEELIVNSVLVEGKENTIINNLVPGVVKTVFNPTPYGLPPSANRDPKQDNDEDGNSLMKSRLTIDDIEGVNVVENADGTVTMTLMAKPSKMSHKGMDSQGKLFNVLGAIDNAVNDITVLSWASGSTAENVDVSYEGGTAVIKLDTSTNEIVEAYYDMEVFVAINHATVTVVKDKSAAVQISYKQRFPADNEFFKKSKGFELK